ncbi:hypothetical protein [Miltoncostaea marina]|uniref:hypothetical protein n=1 Tax=Miltoncostaea marina TaxID=2843215 RepID=UPI001C3D2BEB|nr:hypothetical protein [Miltoncostaea marina]
MTLRAFALILAAVIAVPAAVALMRPSRDGAPRPTAFTLRRPLDALWAVVPVALLILLGALSAIA